MTNYIPLNSILNRIPKIIRETLGDDLILSHALEIYRSFNVADKLETHLGIFTLKNFTTQLPLEIESINSIYQTEEGIITNICGESNSSVDCLNKLEECEECYLKKLRYTGNRKMILNHKFRNCNNCADTFSIDNNKVLTSSIKEGLLLISYNTDIMEDEYYLVIDDSDLLVGLSLYCQAQYFLTKTSSDSINNINIYTDLLNKAQILFTKFKGKRKLNNINPDTISEISGEMSTNRRYLSVWKTISQRV